VPGARPCPATADSEARQDAARRVVLTDGVPRLLRREIRQQAGTRAGRSCTAGAAASFWVRTLHSFPFEFRDMPIATVRQTQGLPHPTRSWCAFGTLEGGQ